MSQLLYTEWFTNSQTGEKESRLVPFEQHQIVGGKILLNYLPDEYYKVPIDGMVEIKNIKPINLPTEYKVDYNASGTISFHPSLEGQEINIPSYYGRGQIYISVERVATLVEGQTVIETLKSLTDDTRQVKDETITATQSANTAINTINTTNTNMSLWEDFDPLQSYLPLNKVSLNRNSYVNILACTGVSPSLESDNANWILMAKHGSDGFSSIIETSFTAIVPNTTHIPHNLAYVPPYDKLRVFGGLYDLELDINDNYTLNIDGNSIDLVGWSLSVNDEIRFELFKNLNEDTIQSEIAQAIVAKNNLDLAVANAKIGDTSLLKANDIVSAINDANSPIVVYTAISDNTTNISFSSVIGLNLSTASYELFYQGILLDETNYTINANNTSIDLTLWFINTGEKIKLKYFTKN